MKRNIFFIFVLLILLGCNNKVEKEIEDIRFPFSVGNQWGYKIEETIVRNNVLLSKSVSSLNIEVKSIENFNDSLQVYKLEFILYSSNNKEKGYGYFLQDQDSCILVAGDNLTDFNLFLDIDREIINMDEVLWKYPLKQGNSWLQNEKKKKEVVGIKNINSAQGAVNCWKIKIITKDNPAYKEFELLSNDGLIFKQSIEEIDKKSDNQNDKIIKTKKIKLLWSLIK